MRKCPQMYLGQSIHDAERSVLERTTYTRRGGGGKHVRRVHIVAEQQGQVGVQRGAMHLNGRQGPRQDSKKKM